jgi:hypothetical protein
MDDLLTFAGYPLTDGSGAITVATVRPATILADVAVAVHPEDERYRDAVGKEVEVPFVERTVPVLADDLVDPEFGTGALKITPGHDPTDFAIGRNHDLPVLTVIGLDGRMSDAAGELAGATQQEADEAVVAWLREHDRLEKREPHRHNVGTSERCHTRIEPLVSLQWWLAMEEPRKPALAALRERRVRYHPESQHAFAIRSLEGVPDWNVSRQLWWGHSTCCCGASACWAPIPRIWRSGPSRPMSPWAVSCATTPTRQASMSPASAFTDRWATRSCDARRHEDRDGRGAGPQWHRQSGRLWRALWGAGAHHDRYGAHRHWRESSHRL